MVKRNFENGKKFLTILKEEGYSLQENFEYKSLKQSVKIKHDVCGMIYDVRIANFLILNRRCPSEKCLDEKRKKTNLDKYGVERAIQNDDVKKRQKETFDRKYGGWALSNREIREKIKQTNLNKYGAENPSKNKEIVKKQKKTKLERYGNENFVNAEKAKQTNIDRFNAENPMQCEEIRKSIISPFQNKEVKEKAIKKKLFNYYKNNISLFEERYKIKPCFNLSEYNGLKTNIYEFKCLKCGFCFPQRIDGTKPIPVCRKCNPIKYCATEVELQDFISKFIEIERNKKFSINGKKTYELDVYIPELKIGFEFDGIYWHSEHAGGKDKYYHVHKNDFFLKQGIEVFHVWENEWLAKKDIVKSIILSKIGKIKNKVYARNLTIKELNNSEYKSFINNYHIQGYSGAIHKMGLVDTENNLLCVLAISKSRFAKSYEYEIVRFANKTNIMVVGGFSKLLKFFIKKYQPKNIVSYADKRYSNGNLYKANNFNLVRTSKPNYFYTKDYKVLESRMKYQKHKLYKNLKNYDCKLTEFENMINNGYDRIWDCGNLVFLWLEKHISTTN